MRKLIEKAIIIALCLYSSYNILKPDNLVFYFLVSIIISVFLDLIQNLKVKIILYGFFVFISFIYPTFLFFIPLILYNLYFDFNTYSLLSLLFLIKNINIVNIIISILSIYLAYIIKKDEDIFSYNKKVRDDLKESTIYLRKYNEQLKIDREKNIHIAVLTERNRIAKEIHDSIGHTISSSILQVAALKVVSDKKFADELDTLLHTLDSGMNEIRNSIHNLYRDSFDLKSKVEELISDMKNYHIEYTYKLNDDLSYNLKFDVLSIIKESLTNILKHSDANKINIKLISQTKFHTIIIHDNGTFPVNILSLHNKGIGLNSMKEIAGKHNGFLNIKNENGFTLHITLMDKKNGG